MGMSNGGYNPDGEKVNEDADEHVGGEEEWLVSSRLNILALLTPLVTIEYRLSWGYPKTSDGSTLF